MRVACLVSSFDMVNVADLDLLQQVRERSDEMVVLVLGDELVQALHGRPPVVPQSERFELVRCLRGEQRVELCLHLDDLRREGVTVYTDEVGLAQMADEVLRPSRRTVSRELRHALAHGNALEGHVA